MDVREKLVELLKSDLPHFKNDVAYWSEEHICEFADHLIANCVTVQEWISVKDKLPIEEAKAHEQEWYEEYCEFLVMIEGGLIPTTLYYDLKEDEWFRINTSLEREAYKVTHWMPMPEPPKGE